MTTWVKLRNYIREELGGDYDYETETISLYIDLDGGRSQFAQVKKRGSLAVDVLSRIGRVDETDILDLLEDDELSRGFGGAIKIGRNIYLRGGSFYLDNCDEEAIASAIFAIAMTADKLEGKYLGVDFS